MSENTQNNTDTAVAMSSQRGWFGRNWKWCIPLLVLVAIILGLFIAVLPFLKLRASQPYKMALEAVQADPAVIEKLGEPVEAGWTISGNLTENNCQIFFDVTGPKETADVTGQARTFDNVWSFSHIEVTFADGSKVSVKTAVEEGGLEEAPAWPQ